MIREMVLSIAVSSKDSAHVQAHKVAKKYVMRRCRGIRDDGSVCNTILSIYNPDPDLCSACQRRFNRRGEKPRLSP